jgi:tripartite-type tricarboxylate transporter receptor subunit TctC
MMRRIGGAVLAATVSVLAHPTRAEEVAEFYKGKQLTIVTWQGPGSSYDSYARLLARHMGKYIPGHPTFRINFMPGAGGVIAANYMSTIAAKDGTFLCMMGPGMVVDQALGLNKSLRADMRKFGWIGSLSSSNQTLVTWHTSPTKSLEIAKQRVTTIGATALGSGSVQFPAFYNNVLGTKFRIITGFIEGRHIEVAMERGELEGRGTAPWAYYTALRPHFVNEKKIIPIIQVGLKKDPGLPDVPLLQDLGKSAADRPLIDFMSKSVAVGRPVATTPGVDKARFAALLTAFDKVVVDAEFKQEAAKQRLDLDPMSGPDLDKVVRSMIDTPEDIRARMKVAMEPKIDTVGKK